MCSGKDTEVRVHFCRCAGYTCDDCDETYVIGVESDDGVGARYMNNLLARMHNR